MRSAANIHVKMAKVSRRVPGTSLKRGLHAGHMAVHDSERLDCGWKNEGEVLIMTDTESS